MRRSLATLKSWLWIARFRGVPYFLLQVVISSFRTWFLIGVRSFGILNPLLDSSRMKVTKEDCLFLKASVRGVVPSTSDLLNIKASREPSPQGKAERYSFSKCKWPFKHR